MFFGADIFQMGISALPAGREPNFIRFIQWSDDLQSTEARGFFDKARAIPKSFLDLSGHSIGDDMPARCDEDDDSLNLLRGTSFTENLSIEFCSCSLARLGRDQLITAICDLTGKCKLQLIGIDTECNRETLYSVN